MALPQADMTKGSLEAITITCSIPLALRASMFWMKPGRWFAWHVGVKAPGTATRTTFLFLKAEISRRRKKKRISIVSQTKQACK